MTNPGSLIKSFRNEGFAFWHRLASEALVNAASCEYGERSVELLDKAAAAENQALTVATTDLQRELGHGLLAATQKMRERLDHA